MARGNNQSKSRIFMTVSFGKFRQKVLDNGQKVDETVKGAVKRVTQQGQDSWAIEYDFVSGYIQNIFYKSNEGTKFPASFEVILKDDEETLQISFAEDSRFWLGFMEVLPNVDLKYPVTINVFDYINKTKERKVGINIEQPGNPNTHEVSIGNNLTKDLVNSYYKQYITESKTWNFLNGYPIPAKDINWKDKDDTDIYYKGVKKFLRSEFSRLFAGKFSDRKDEVIPSDVEEMTKAETDGADDLPF